MANYKLFPKFVLDMTHHIDVLTRYQEFLDNRRFVVMRGERTGKVICQETSKRGNRVYVKNLEYRLATHLNTLDRVEFFNHDKKISEYQELRRARQTAKFSCFTHGLFIVLTVKPENMSLDSSYRLGSDLNRFVSCLSKQFGCRVGRWHSKEAHESGYCHYNLIIIFDKPIPVYPIFDNDGNFKRWCVGSFYNSRGLKDKISSYWSLGFVDVQGFASANVGYTEGRQHPVKSGNLSIPYLVKYMLKSVDGGVNDENYKSFFQCAMMWEHNARTFSLCRNFHEILSRVKGNDLINIHTKKAIQTVRVVYSDKFLFVGVCNSYLVKETVEFAKKYWKPPNLRPCVKGVFSSCPAVKLRKHRLLTNEQAYDVWGGRDSHDEIPYAYEWL